MPELAEWLRNEATSRLVPKAVTSHRTPQIQALEYGVRRLVGAFKPGDLSPWPWPATRLNKYLRAEREIWAARSALVSS